MSPRMIAKKMISALIGGFGIAALSVTVASAATIIFEDTFNRTNSSTVGNGWSELEKGAKDVAINSNVLRLRDILSGNPDAAAASKTIVSTGFENISASFRWQSLGPNDGPERLKFAWALDPSPLITDQGAWTTLGTFSASGTSWHIANVVLGAAAANTMFDIMFWTNLRNDGTKKEGFLVDYVVVSGDAISAVPVPAALPLFGTGLGILGFLGWRRRRKADLA